MAKKTIQGLSGSGSAAGFNLKVSAWSANYVMENVDTTGFEDGGYRTFEPTISTMTGSLSGTAVFDAASTNLIPAGLLDGAVMTGDDLDLAKVAVVLTAKTGCTYSGTVVVSGVSLNRAVDGKGEVNLDFVFTGPITQAWGLGA